MSEALPADGKDVTDLAYWFPLVKAAGLPVPETRIVVFEGDLSDLLDGKEPDGFEEFIDDLWKASEGLGVPFFLRTGHGSGKHEWRETCFVDHGGRQNLMNHVAALVEWSHLVDMFGLPTETWVLRRMIETDPLFLCTDWEGFPVTREFRVFIQETKFEAIYPYWPADAVEHGRPDVSDWRERIAEASLLGAGDEQELRCLAGMASGACGGGYWSIDFLQDRFGKWWLTDMAAGARSYKPGAPL